MEKQKDLISPSLMKTSKSQLTAEQPSTKKGQNLPIKIYYFQRQRRSHSETAGGAHS